MTYVSCEVWEKGDQINLWTYWQGYQLKDIDEKGVDILLVGQDWGNPDNNKNAIEQIKRIQNGENTFYDATISRTDKVLTEMFRCIGCDITNKDPGKRLFFTNYSLGYREGSETGGMTKSLMKMDKELFEDLVTAIRPKVIICLGRITYEMVSGKTANGFVDQLRKGSPFKALYPNKPDITVYGVAHCGSRGVQNVKGIDNMKAAWEEIGNEI